MMKSLLRLLLINCLAVSAAFAQPATRRADPVEVDRIVAVVNEEAITQFELKARIDSVVSQLNRRGTPLPPQDVLRKQMLERLIMDKVQLQYARDVGIRVDDAQLDAAIGRIAENNRMSMPDFRQALERDGIVFAKFREEIREEMTITRLREREVENRMVISDGEVDAYLAGEGRQAPEEFALSHILFRAPESATPEQIEKLRAKAEEALAKLNGGDDFGQVAAAYSDAPDALQGGDLGWRQADRLPPAFVEAAKKLQPGQVSAIVRTSNGFSIVKLKGKRGGSAAQSVQQTQVRHILIKVNEIVSEAEAQRKLEALREKLEHGADFADLARQFSQDGSAPKGGDLGWIYPGDTVPEFERAMDALKVGEVSQPVRSPFGFHLIQVLDRRVQDVSNERRRAAARQALRERKIDEAYQDWLRQLRDRAYVEYRLDDK